MGKDVSQFFPWVVKNVVSQNFEVKKLTYVYLVHYAEMQPDAVLLSVNSFQKDMSDKSQLIRALALRVMSSIRVPIILPIIVSSIEKCATDPSAYVRKTAAHAISKVFNLDQTHKSALIDIIKMQLKDNSTLVLASVVAAFNEVCPERYDLIHEYFRKICHLAIDTDEWGQIMMINLICRYVKKHFSDPFVDVGTTSSNVSEDDSETSEKDTTWEKDSQKGVSKVTMADLHPDHAFALQCILPLLQCRNSGVILAVASLFFYTAPQSELPKVGKALVRLLRNRREVAYVILCNIDTFALSHPAAFSPFVKEFFVSHDDPQYIALLKLEILSHIISVTNVSSILKELQVYVRLSNTEIVAHAIRVMGKCATQISDVRESILRQLVGMLHNSSESVVTESVVVIRTLIQHSPAEFKDVIITLAKRLSEITSPVARAAVVWVIGEYSSFEGVKLYAPDVLRIMAKSFSDEEECVRLAVTELAIKCFLNDPETCTLLCQFVVSQARYDRSYDVRDKVRFYRRVMFPPENAQNTCPLLKSRATELFTGSKPSPDSSHVGDERHRFAMGSLSHVVRHATFGYVPLPDWAERNSEDHLRSPTDSQKNMPWHKRSVSHKAKKYSKGFYSDSDSDSDSDTYDSDSDTDSDYSSSGSRSGSYSGSESDSQRSRSSASRSSTGSSYTSSNTGSDSDSDESAPPSHSSVLDDNTAPPVPIRSSSAINAEIDSLLSSLPAAIQSGSGGSPVRSPVKATRQETRTAVTNSLETGTRVTLLHHANSGGLQVECVFLRTPSHMGTEFNAIRAFISNHDTYQMNAIEMDNISTATGVNVIPMTEIAFLGPGQSSETLININFGGKASAVKFNMKCSKGSFPISLVPPVGELFLPFDLEEPDFVSQKAALSGMLEQNAQISTKSGQNVAESLFTGLNFGVVPETPEGHIYLCGRSRAANQLCLIQAISEPHSPSQVSISIGCESAMLGSMVLGAVKKLLR